MRIDHVGIAVRSIDRALAIYRDALGCQPLHRGIVAHELVEIAVLAAGESRIELVQPTGGDSTIARFLDRHGEGMHHIALQVDDLDRTMSALRAAGRKLVGDGTKVGAEGYRYVFVHPRDASGVLLELVERS